MKNFSILCCVTLTLVSCTVSPTSSNSSPQSVAQASPISATAPSVRWDAVPLTGGSKDLNLIVNNRNYRLKNVSSHRPESRSGFVALGVPANALLANTYHDVGAHEEDGGKMYVMVKGTNVLVYDGYIAPGDMHNVDWKLFKTIPF